MADAVGKDDVIAGDVERLAGPVQLVGELRLEELRPAAAGAVQDHDRIDDQCPAASRCGVPSVA